MSRILFLCTLLLVSIPGYAQEVEKKKALQQLQSRGELYLKFDTRKFDVHKHGKHLSLDHKIEGNYQYAYVNLNQFQELIKLGLDFNVQTPPSLLHEAKMAKKTNDIFTWDRYPTYEQYIEFMESMASKYPEICTLENFGTSLKGRKLLALKISDNAKEEENEPNLFYTSTMHGDETTGYILLLRLANYLLENYPDNKRILDLVDNTEIWINPLSNPDGTYAAGNHTVNGATRNNAATHLSSAGNPGVDLNRNFPDPRVGPNPDNNEHQPETTAMIDFMKKHNFVLTANFHSGAEVVNYPWDTWTQQHPDNDWYRTLSREYADTVHSNSHKGYFDFLENGITNGATWYWVEGGRQDYTNYFLHGREVTIELSDTKLPPANTLPRYWNYNYRSLLNFIKQSHYGIRGIITDAETGKPLRAKIEVVNHDFDESEVYSKEKNGNYHRFISPNIYTLRFSKAGYLSKTIDNVSVFSNQATELNVELTPSNTSADRIGIESVQFSPNPLSTESKLSFNILKSTETQFFISSISGKVYFQHSEVLEPGEHQFGLPQLDLPTGIYICNIRLGKQHKFMKVLVTK